MRFDGEQPALREQTVYWNRDNANIAPVKDRTKQRNTGRKYESERERERKIETPASMAKGDRFIFMRSLNRSKVK